MSTVPLAGLIPATSNARTLGVSHAMQYQSTLKVPSQRCFAWIGLPFALATFVPALPHHRHAIPPRSHSATTPPVPVRLGRVCEGNVMKRGVMESFFNSVLNGEGTSAGVGSNHDSGSLVSGSEPYAQRVYRALPGFKLGTTILRTLCVFPLTNKIPFGIWGYWAWMWKYGYAQVTVDEAVTTIFNYFLKT